MKKLSAGLMLLLLILLLSACGKEVQRTNPLRMTVWNIRSRRVFISQFQVIFRGVKHHEHVPEIQALGIGIFFYFGCLVFSTAASLFPPQPISANTIISENAINRTCLMCFIAAPSFS